jgi:hypothetical protein
VWTADQLRTFLQLTTANRHHPAFWLAATTGMRRSEFLGTLWHQLDVDQRRLAVSRTVVAVDYQIHESTGKTRSSRRSIDLDDRTMDVLGQWRKRQRTELGKYDPNSPLFTRTDGNVIHPHSLSQAFERAVAKTNLPRISLHDPLHPRHPAHQSRGPPQGGIGTAGSLIASLHDGHLPAHPPRNASRRRRHLRLPAPTRRSTGFYPVEHPVEHPKRPPPEPGSRSQKTQTMSGFSSSSGGGI